MIILISILLLVILSTILLLLYHINIQKLKKEYLNNWRSLLGDAYTEAKAAHETQLRVLQEKYDLLEEKEASLWNSTLQEYEQKKAQLTTELNKNEQRLVERKQAVDEIIEQLEHRRREVEESYQDTISLGQEKIDQELEHYRALRTEQINTTIDQATIEKEKAAAIAYAKWMEDLEQSKEAYQEEIVAIASQLEEYRSKQAAINTEILRRRELEEKQDFYRIKLTDAQKQDIHYLLSIVDNIKNPVLLYKLIWSEYLQKPFGAMLKNVLENKDPRCVIYKITNTQTGEIYIGKTKAEVSKRWTEHIKTSLGIGSAARSKIHEALFNHWDEFTFEILEKIEKETDLSLREKYYINFYQSNIYGYNMNSGG